jgi:hypothetical protein
MWVALSPLHDSPEPRHRRATLVSRNGPTWKIPGHRARSRGRQRGAHSRSRSLIDLLITNHIAYRMLCDYWYGGLFFKAQYICASKFLYLFISRSICSENKCNQLLYLTIEFLAK